VQANQLSPKPLPDDPAKAPVFAELEKWHADVLADFKVNLVTLHDPFMPIETVARPPERDQQSESDRRRLPMIQRLALNQFTLSAIIVAANPSDNTALVDSGGVGYLIRKGTKIGPNNGIVKEITDTKVIIEEPDVSYSGGETARITEFKLNILDNDAVIQEGEGEGAGAAGASPAPSGDGNV
jgi:type IV pilus assembly protein PilP